MKPVPRCASILAQTNFGGWGTEAASSAILAGAATKPERKRGRPVGPYPLASCTSARPAPRPTRAAFSNVNSQPRAPHQLVPRGLESPVGDVRRARDHWCRGRCSSPARASCPGHRRTRGRGKRRGSAIRPGGQQHGSSANAATPTATRLIWTKTASRWVRPTDYRD